MRYLIILLLLSGCVVGTLPTATPWATNTPTPEPTPTQEIGVCWQTCTVKEDVLLYTHSDLEAIAYVAYQSSGAVHMRQAKVSANEQVRCFDRTDNARMVITVDDPPRVGWLALDYLPDECK
jgi:hypothetical protein